MEADHGQPNAQRQVRLLASERRTAIARRLARSLELLEAQLLYDLADIDAECQEAAA